MSTLLHGEHVSRIASVLARDDHFILRYLFNSDSSLSIRLQDRV